MRPAEAIEKRGKFFARRLPRAGGGFLYRRLALWLTILQLSIQERIIYRGEFFLGALMRFLPIVTQILLWAAIFEAVGTVGRAEIQGYSYRQVVAYYLLTMISRAFSSMPGLASGIARDIRDGTIKKYLVQPVDLLGFLLLHRIAHKLVYYVMALGPFVLLFYLCQGFFDGWPAPEVMAAYVASLVLAFLLGFYLEATIGLIGFWFLEVSSLIFVFLLLSFFFSGHMFPLDMLPIPWREMVAVLPFQYLAYFPSAIFLGKVSGEDLWTGLAAQAIWTLVAFILARIVFRLGLRHYSGFGG
ncbi:MAG: ABC-2 family transporter protein [Thermoguttaceae bacterium]|nr:ABC-2 family transporter protein [Thermoguttaceae bacterium]MDW8077954.1 ABC-2 family transporter protein [Thermoguttaceae bacterium]